MSVDILGQLTVDFKKENKVKVIEILKELFDYQTLNESDDYIWIEFFNHDVDNWEQLKAYATSVSYSEFECSDYNAFSWDKEDEELELSRTEFEQLLNDDKDFKEQWSSNDDRGYNESDFLEWHNNYK